MNDPILQNNEVAIEEKVDYNKIKLVPVTFSKRDMFKYRRMFLQGVYLDNVDSLDIKGSSKEFIIEQADYQLEDGSRDERILVKDTKDTNNNNNKDDQQTYFKDTKVPITNDISSSYLPDSFRTYFQYLGHQEPTQLQQHAWPLVLTGLDVLGISLPGSGKTAGFLFPMVPHIQDRIANNTLVPGSPCTLVLVPTRELARQIYAVSHKMNDLFGIRTLPIYGGVAKDPQIESLHNVNPHILISTPGRLVDLINMGQLNLSGVTMLVLDEADKMLSMGLIPQLNNIRSQIMPRIQTLFFSATFPDSLKEIQDTWLNNPIKLKIGSESLPSQTHIKQVLHFIAENKKAKRLLRILPPLIKAKKIIVFFNKISHLLTISKRLYGIKHECIYGSMQQSERDKIIKNFMDNPYQTLLLATDVMGRGIHIDDLDMVINYNLPMNLEQYCHRIGRCGRNGRAGEAVSFVSPKNLFMVQELVTLLEDNKQEVPMVFKKQCNEEMGADFTLSKSNRELKKEAALKRIEKQAAKKKEKAEREAAGIEEEEI
eukprot:gene12958-15227_t